MGKSWTPWKGDLEVTCLERVMDVQAGVSGPGWHSSSRALSTVFSSPVRPGWMGKNTERWVLCVRFSRAPLWLLVGATGEARDLLEVVVTRQRETVLAGIRGWWWKWGEVNGVQHKCWGLAEGVCAFWKREASRVVLKCLSEKLQGRVDLYRGLADWEEVVLIWGRWRTGESALNMLSCKSLLVTQGGGCCIGRWGLELRAGGEELGGRYCY